MSGDAGAPCGEGTKAAGGGLCPTCGAAGAEGPAVAAAGTGQGPGGGVPEAATAAAGAKAGGGAAGCGGGPEARGGPLKAPQSVHRPVGQIMARCPQP